jgi:sacsin
VYHWTDNPSIYSENRLLFQDPQHSWADSGGSVYETVHAPDDTEDPNCHRAKAQLQAFSQFPFDINSPYPGTIIRIPLRTGNQASTSKICRKETTTQQIRKFLLRFAQELGESGLLFVKHITKVTLRVDKEELSVTQVLNVDEVCLSRQQVLHSLKSREDCSKSLEMEIRHFLGVNVSPQNRRYVIQHVLRRGSGDQSLDDWAREGKLLPWVAVAVQVNPLGSHPCSPKPLSSTLCLPKKIKQPAYMHGLWAIAPDRQRLSTESSGESWNKYLFSTLIATAWKDLLLYRNPLSPTNERFQFWPNPVETIEDPWDSLHDTIVESAINEDLPIWNTAFNCVNSKDAFFAEQKLENDNSAPALAKIGMPVVYLPSALYVLIREAPVKLQTLQPATALAYLHANIDKLLLASPEMKIKLLEYCFAAKAFAQLAEIPIWPLLSGSFANLKKSLTFLPRSVDEMELFRRSKPDLTIDVSKLTSQALKAMHHNHDKLFKETPMRYRAITDLIEEWPTLYPILESSGFHVGRPTRLDKTLQGLWAWVSQRGSEIQEEDIVTVMGSFPDSLFLFPLRGDFVRHFASKSQDMPTLIVMDKELEALLVQVTKGSDVPPGILDESILQKAGLGLAERIGSKLPATQIETSENLFGFAPWLAAAKDLLLDLSDEDRRLLIKHISRVTKKRYDPSHGSMIANFLRQLPIFRKVVPRISVAGDDTRYLYQFR